ncbi:MAG TPA: Ig-like domain-containing protein [Myxococcales bacterium]|nr:Ig-like domain-containing protein [Myxococcales bacterium]
MAVVLTCIAACGGTSSTGPTGPATVQLTVSSSANPSAEGQSVTFTASFSGGSPAGTVVFQDGAAALPACGAQVIGSGVATCAASLAVGTHSITAVFAGDASFTAATSAALSQTVNKGSSAVAVASSLNPAVFGQAVTFTATVTTTPAGSGASGTVAFSDGGVAIGGCGAVSVSNQTAACTVAALSTGSHAVTAIYSGDATFNASPASSAVSETVSKATPVITSFVFTSIAVGGNGDFTLNLTGNAIAVPTGAVTITDASTVVSSCTLAAETPPNAGCTTGVSTLPTGSQTFVATYPGDTNFLGATASKTVTVQ